MQPETNPALAHAAHQQTFDQERIVVATVTEAGFVGIELQRANLAALFEQVHNMYTPEGLAQQVSSMMDKAPQYPMTPSFSSIIKRHSS